MSDLWFPGANRNHPAPNDGGSIVSGYEPKCLWHDTETQGLPSYSTGFFPNMTICNGTPFQHIPANRAARALKNPSGGVETNRGNVFQIEVCGFANKVQYHPIMSEVAEWLKQARGVPMESTVKWRSYPDSFGATSIRLSGTAWKKYRGHLGHQHAPENQHGDPGWPFPIQQILKGDDMTVEELDDYFASERGQRRIETAVTNVLRMACDPGPTGDRPASVWFDTVARQVSETHDAVTS